MRKGERETRGKSPRTARSYAPKRRTSSMERPKNEITPSSISSDRGASVPKKAATPAKIHGVAASCRADSMTGAPHARKSIPRRRLGIRRVPAARAPCLTRWRGGRGGREKRWISRPSRALRASAGDPSSGSSSGALSRRSAGPGPPRRRRRPARRRRRGSPRHSWRPRRPSRTAPSAAALRRSAPPRPPGRRRPRAAG